MIHHEEIYTNSLNHLQLFTLKEEEKAHQKLKNYSLKTQNIHIHEHSFPKGNW